MAARAVGTGRVHKQGHAARLVGAERGLAANDGVKLGAEGLQRRPLKRCDGQADLRVSGLGVVEDVDAKLLAKQRCITRCGNLVDHGALAGIVHLQRVQEGAHGLQFQRVGTAIPEMAANGLGRTFLGLERKHGNETGVAISRRVTQAQRRGQAALSNANARSVVASKTLVGLVAGHAGCATRLGQIGVVEDLLAQVGAGVGQWGLYGRWRWWWWWDRFGPHGRRICGGTAACAATPTAAQGQ